MFFLMRCFHHPNKDAARDQFRPLHREWVQNGGNGLAQVFVGSAIWDNDGKALGHFGILEAQSLTAAEAFAQGDPFNREGIVERIELERLADGFQAHRITEPMTKTKASMET